MSACIRCGHVQKHDCDAELGRFEAIRAEAKAEGAAEERADILWWLRSAPPSCATLADAIAIVDARGPAPSPAPKCTCGRPRWPFAETCDYCTPAPKDEALREKLAALAHEQWSGWMRHLFGRCVDAAKEGQPSLTVIPGWAAERWKRQMNTPYSQLSEEEKDSDRKEADRVLALLSPPKNEAREKALVEALRSECDAFDYHVETGGKTQPGYTQEVWQRNRDAIRGQSPENDPALLGPKP